MARARLLVTSNGARVLHVYCIAMTGSAMIACAYDQFRTQELLAAPPSKESDDASTYQRGGDLLGG